MSVSKIKTDIILYIINLYLILWAGKKNYILLMISINSTAEYLQEVGRIIFWFLISINRSAEYLQEVGRIIFDVLQTADPDSIW